MPLSSQLFSGDPLLEAIAADQERIAQGRNDAAPGVLKVQTALLQWDPACLPSRGADGVYGPETASAVVRFKVEVLEVEPAQAIPDVGPRTVITLDAMRADVEQTPPIEIPPDVIAEKDAGDPALLAMPGVSGTGIGLIIRDGLLTNEVGVSIYLAAGAAPPDGLPTSIAGLPVTVQEGEITPAQDLREDGLRYDPLRGGIAIGIEGVAEGVGTLGAVVLHNRTKKLVGLTNQHVVGEPGSKTVLQPGANFHVHGHVSKDGIGTVLETVQPMPPIGLLLGPIAADAALVTLEGRRTSAAIVGAESGGPDLVKAITRVAAPYVGQRVRKRGYRTKLTHGRVTGYVTHTWEDKTRGLKAMLRGQLQVYGGPGDPPPGGAQAATLAPIVARGDSGALVLDKETPTAVGLLHGEQFGGLCWVMTDIMAVIGALPITVDWKKP